MDFSEVKNSAAKLRQEVTAGRMTAGQFKARLKEMMIQDESGDWWMIGYETGQWYRHDGQDWVRVDPPGYIRPVPVSMPKATGKYRLNFLRGLGLTLLGVLIYKISTRAILGIYQTARVEMTGYLLWPFEFVPPLFSVLFGPWVGGFTSAL
jgi:hypothetical protein